MDDRLPDAWDGAGMLSAFQHATASLRSRVDEVNALNVFPVPDGDTGSNMLATMQAAVSEAESVPAAERSVPRIAAALSLGALMGARGNSGVILSQVFRGLGDAVVDARVVGGVELVGGFEMGCRAAFAAVAVPVEGTMLTVIRDASRAAATAATGNGELDYVLSAAVAEAAASVQRTPSLLPILRRAGVVDAGGRGIEIVLGGALASLRGEKLPTASISTTELNLPDLHALEGDDYGFETVFFVQPLADKSLDAEKVRRKLAKMGGSVLVAGDSRALKIHIHNDRPDRVIAYGLTLGTLSRINVENLDRQAGEVRARVDAATHPADGEPAKAVEVTDTIGGTAVVAVAPGKGIARIFESLGVQRIVTGGQGANPSAGELAEAIRATRAESVIVLPNNSNVRMAARQAGDLVKGVRVHVVPTRNSGEGVAAMLVFDAELPARKSARAMTKAAEALQTLVATKAVRDARFGRHRVRLGQYIVLGPTEGLLAVDNDRTSALIAAVGKLKTGFELMTVYRGEGITETAGEALRRALLASLPGVEVEVVDGGQPHYDFLIAAE